MGSLTTVKVNGYVWLDLKKREMKQTFTIIEQDLYTFIFTSVYRKGIVILIMILSLGTFLFLFLYGAKNRA
jgi:hypothetical protein